MVSEPACARERPAPSGAASARAAAGKAKAKAAKKRSIWWRLHQWAGLQMSVFLAFVFVTGTLAVFSYEMDWMARPAMWASPTPVEDRADWGEVGAAAQAHAPDAEILNVYGPIHRASAFDVVARQDGTLKHIYVHPRTGEVTGEGGWPSVQRFLRNAHRHLMLPVKLGVSIVTLAAVFLAVTLVTSFWVYKKWWRGFLRWPKGRTARALIGDIHRVAGVWSIWFVVLMILTSAWYFIEVWGGSAPPANPREPAAPVQAEGARFDDPADALDAGIGALLAENPDYRVERILWPGEFTPHFQVHGWTDKAILVRPRANTAYIHAETGQVLDVVDPSALNAHQRIAEAADPLHFGTFGGYWTKTIWFVFGAALSALSVTGVAIYAMRIAKMARRPATWGHGLAGAWRAMGSLRWAALGLVVLPFALIPVVLY